MRWFLDTEFAENGETIKLISLALVSEAGEERYWVLEDGWSREDCSDWVKENVLPHLGDVCRTPRVLLRRRLRDLLLHGQQPAPQIWGYYSDYDWVAFCQLFGTMMDLPDGMPMYCRDLKQLMDMRGLSREIFPPNESHNALEDARWIRDAYKQIGRMP